ncbi:MAG: ABC transporter ATP-binding protein [Anaerolineae bacterium]|nr:ABC transporter ATP-binding protein [Anaerolineae bacterium]
MAPIIHIQDLRKQYDPPNGVWAVKDVDLDIEEGEIFSFLGPNGAGKTTTISMISGLLTPSGGDAIIDGHSIIKEPMAAKEVIGVVPQEIALYPTLTARQNLRFFGQLYGLTGAELDERVDEVLDFIDLRDRANEKVEKYSGGMKRRVNIGVGLLHRPKIVYMDEPTVGVDPQSRRRILDTVKALNREHSMTVLYTTHYMEEAQELSHRVGIIDHGEMIAIGAVGDLISQIGENDTLRLRVGETPDKLLLRLQEIEGVTKVSADQEGEITILAKRGRRALPEAITVADEMGLRIESVKIEEPDLEAVFLHLTGRALRE